MKFLHWCTCYLITHISPDPTNIQANVLTAYSNVHLSGLKTRHYPAQKMGGGDEKHSGGGAEHRRKNASSP